jgi:hypothetical protein
VMRYQFSSGSVIFFMGRTQVEEQQRCSLLQHLSGFFKFGQPSTAGLMLSVGGRLLLAEA